MRGTILTMKISTILKIIPVVLIIPTSLSCYIGWKELNGICYKATNYKTTFPAARDFCKVFNGDVAFINATSVLRHIQSLPIFDRNKTYWLHENSEINGDSIPEQFCLPNARLSSQCSEMNDVVCQMQSRYNFTCPATWYLINKRCYKLITFPGNQQFASTICAAQGGRLAILDNVEALDSAWIATSNVYGNTMIWVGANESQWMNGSSFNRFNLTVVNVASNPVNASRCIGIRPSPDLLWRTKFEWILLNCNEKLNFLCESTALPRTLNNSAASSPLERTATTDPPALHCPIGYNWKEHEVSGFCYWETTYEADRLNWFQARDYCQRYGGDLATYDDAEQERHALGGALGHYKGLWFGLKRDTKNHTLNWVDGISRTYNNWKTGEPNIGSASKFCAVHSPTDSEWALDYCGVRRWFICKSRKVYNPILPDKSDINKKISCNISGPSTYSNRWYIYKDHCYLVTDTNKYSWYTADNFCQDNGGQLASIHSYEETDFILQTSSYSSTTNYWIGLASVGIDSSSSWTDSSPVDFIYWEDGSASTSLNRPDTHRPDLCFTFNKDRGFWKPDHCNQFLGVICKRGANSSFDVPTTEPTTIRPGSCERGWYALGNNCYKVFGEHWSKRVTWFYAKNNCTSLGANLVSIHSEEEQNFLTDLTIGLRVEIWIGLQNKDVGQLFLWSDESPIDFTNWAIGEPKTSSEYESCTEMTYNKNQLRKWNSIIHCKSVKAYICKKQKNPLLDLKEEDPFLCDNISNWLKLGSACFGIFDNVDDNSTWLDAQSKCRNFNANLLLYKNEAIGMFFERKLSKKNNFYWIGVRQTISQVYHLVTDRPIVFSNWLKNQPQIVSDTLSDNCVAMASDGSWVVRNCREKHPFICEWESESNDTSLVEVNTKSCPNTLWTNFGGDACYLIHPELKISWTAAMTLCFKSGGQLASIHSLSETDKIIQYLHERVVTITASTALHIGFAKNHAGSFGWVDQSPVDFTNWDDDTKKRDCVKMNGNSGKWKTVDCTDYYSGYICSFSLEKEHVNVSGNNTEKLEKDAASTKLGGGTIFGIIFVSLIVITAVVLGSCYMKRKTIYSSTLLEQDNL